MRAAVFAALREHKEGGDYVVVWQDGHVVRIAAEDIVIPDEDETSSVPEFKPVV
jgi:hypothetical protein